MMLPVSHVQIPYLKDLVTLVDPTSRFSFLNFLAEERRLHRFLFAELDRVSRIEYEQYDAWVCAQLDCCRFDTPVSTVKLRDRVFEVRARDTVVARTANIAIGTGQRPRVPSFVRPLLDGNVIHSSDLLHMRPACSGKRVLIVGGNNANGPVASADLFGTDGVFSSAALMQTPRSGHTATILPNGNVLVTGGTTSGGGITNSAEIYDPSANSWTLLSGSMVDARSGHTASLLPDGRVLLAGGQNSGGAINSLEIFDPASGNFSSGRSPGPKSACALERCWRCAPPGVS